MSTSVSLKTRDQEPAAYTPYLHAPVIAPCDYPIRFHAHARNVLRMCVGVLTRMYVRITNHLDLVVFDSCAWLNALKCACFGHVCVHAGPGDMSEDMRGAHIAVHTHAHIYTRKA